jgi:hypothetical protein
LKRIGTATLVVSNPLVERAVEAGFEHVLEIGDSSSMFVTPRRVILVHILHVFCPSLLSLSDA